MTEEELNDYSDAIGAIESGGKYDLVGPQTKHGRALGKHQVMEEFLPEWTKQVFGKVMTPQQFLADPDSQEALFHHKFGGYNDKFGNPQDAASAWLTGQPLAKAGNVKDVFGTDAKTYVNKFNKNLKNIQMKKQQTAMNDDEDLLSSFVKGSSKQEAAPEDDEDLLGAFLQKKELEPEAAKKKPVLSNPGYMAQAIAAHQGDGYGDTAIRTAAGAGQGFTDVANTLSQGITYAGEKGANALERAGVISPESTAKVKDWRQNVNEKITNQNKNFDAAAGDSTAAGLGRIGGQIAGSVPAFVAGAALAPEAATGLAAANPWTASLLAGAAGGGAANALTSSTSEEPLGQQIAEGAATGAVLGPLGKGASKLGGAIFGSSVGDETAQLAKLAREKYNIPITSGQMSSNPTARFFDSVLQRLPFTGYGARTAEQQSGLNRAIANEIGADSDIISPKVVKTALKSAGKDMENFVNEVGALPGDKGIADHLSQIYKDAKVNIPDKLAAVENRIMEVIKGFGKGKKLDAKTYAGLIRKHGPLDPKMADGKVAHYVSEIRTALDDLVERNSPPEKVAAFKNARYRYAIGKAIEPLAKKAGPEGNISPALLLNKAKGGNLEELANIGQRFMKEPPSSGTAERGSLLALGAKAAGGLTGLGATAGGAYYFDPEHFQRDALLLASLAAGGRGASKLLRSDLLANRAISGGLKKGVEQASKKGNPLAGLIAPAAGSLMLSRTSAR